MAQLHIIYYIKGKGDMETYWLQSAAKDEIKEEFDSSDDENVAIADYF